jgi:hypothetical protein
MEQGSNLLEMGKVVQGRFEHACISMICTVLQLERIETYCCEKCRHSENFDNALEHVYIIELGAVEAVCYQKLYSTNTVCLNCMCSWNG